MSSVGDKETEVLDKMEAPENMDNIERQGQDTSDEFSEDRSRRIRTMTEKGQYVFEASKRKFVLEIESVKSDLHLISRNIEPYSNDLDALIELKAKFMKETTNYDDTCKKYLDFLKRTNTQECLSEVGRLTSEIQHVSCIVGQDVGLMNKYINELRSLEKQQSVKSNGSKSKHSSRRSTSSTVSSALSKKRAKAEAEKVRLKFAELEAQIAKEKADLEHKRAIEAADFDKKQANIEADLTLLNTRKEAAVLEAEADALQGEIDDRLSQVLPDHVPINAPERTAAYVDYVNAMLPNNVDRVHQQPTTTLDAGANPFTPINPNLDYPMDSRNRSTFDPQRPSEKDIASDFTRFLLKKDLLMSRFHAFNDKPEYYPSWKDSFQKIILDIGADDSEEIDLLLKWTGSQSKTHVQSIKAANMCNPSNAKVLIWDRLNERYGSPVLIEHALKVKLAAFPRIINKDYAKLYDLSDILSEISSVKESDNYKAIFSYFDSSIGVSPIVSKLPYHLQERWTRTAVDYNSRHGAIYPPFHVFVNFVKEQSKVRNNPSFIYENSTNQWSSIPTSDDKTRKPEIRTRKSNSTDVNGDKPQQTSHSSIATSDSQEIDPSAKCIIHGTKHNLNECRTFKSKPIMERRRLLKTHRVCFHCCMSNSHVQRDCPVAVKCDECGRTDHPTALHITFRPSDSSKGHGGEKSANEQDTVETKCTQICFDKFGGKSCAKIVLVEGFLADDPDRKLRFYAILDDQSNRTLAKSEIFDFFGSTSDSDYVLSTCSGKTHITGRKLSGLMIQSLDGTTLKSPDIIECNQIPDSRDEIPTPEVALNHTHLNDLTDSIPPLDSDSKILVLIGRDLINAHHVLDQRLGPDNSPYAQKLPLGWTIIGETCLGKVHHPDIASVKKVHLLQPDRVSIFPPCHNDFKIEEVDSFEAYDKISDNYGHDIFVRSLDDDKPGLSVDDREFLKLMDKYFKKDENGNWSAPLPFRSDRQRLPNNKTQAWNRAKGLHVNLTKNPTKREHFLTFMQGILQNGHAEKASDVSNDQEQWFLPIFGVYHPKKPGKLRAVFDSSCQFDELSLNSVLLGGPDVTNSLLGVLLRFRKERVAVMGDIQQMFYCLKVDEEHRNFLKFFWYTDNDFTKPLTTYRMCVHVFGNCPSPSIATYGLRKTAQEGELEYGSDMVEFVSRDFYVDDGLTSKPTSAEVIDLMTRTKKALQQHGNIRLHKISSNDEKVMRSFDSDDLASGFKDLDFSEGLPVQRSLGMTWDLESDSFMYAINQDLKPYTRRGLLSTINSIYDPIGYLAPVTIKGKLLLRSAMTGNIAWDDPLPQELYRNWETWRSSLFDLEKVRFPRMFIPVSFSQSLRRTVHIYSDASEQAIAAVGYIQLDDHPKLGFIMGKAKVAPVHGHTIPRLELCGALLASELGLTISNQLDIPMSDIRYYTDSRVVLGYVYNTSRRFYQYVSNRVARIHKVSESSQWSYVHTDANPADQATRSIEASRLQTSLWLSGPTIHKQLEKDFALIEPDSDREIRSEVTSTKTEVQSDSSLGSHRFERFSSWKSLVRTIARIKDFVSRRSSHNSESTASCQFHDAEKIILRSVQSEVYSDELTSVRENQPLNKRSSLLKLDPFIDSEGILRVGGRISLSSVSSDERHPIVIPSKHWIAILIVRYFHEKIQHQGRHFTSGATRTGGYWIVGGKRLISSLIYKCVTCRRLRRPTEQQKMADLPSDRVNPEPPFTSIGIDTFGPWSVVSRRTRGGIANAKRWAIIFTCMSTRGVHIEVVEELSSSSFINAFKRFTSIRGQVKLIKSDRGTNFIGATDSLGINTINVEDEPTKQFLYDNGIQWRFNSPHSSHMGGIWERMIRTTRSILDSMLSKVPGNDLSQEVLVTLLAEVTAIINSRPLTCVSTDTDEPFPLTPNLLITQKPNVLVPKDVSFSCKDMYHAQWKRVQYLADIFWKRWYVEYLQTLQIRQKWNKKYDNIQEGDIILLKDNQVSRINWPMGMITKVFPSSDNLVRKVELRIVHSVDDKNCAKTSIYIRPVTEIVLLLSKSCNNDSDI